MTTKALSRHELFAYGLPGITINMVLVLFSTYLPKYYSDVVHVDIKLIGMIILAARFINAFCYPLIGILSDRTQSRWGRRRPWIFIASTVLAILLLLINNPPTALSHTAATLWFACLYILLVVSNSCLDLPYFSLGAELSQHYHERNVLLGVRGAMQNLGILIVPSLFLFIEYFLKGSLRDQHTTFGATAAIIMVLCCYYSVFHTKEPTLRLQQRPLHGFLKHFAILKSNHPYRLLVTITTLQFIGIACTTSLFLYFVQYVLQSQMGNQIILAYTLSVVAGIPIWIFISNRFDKRNTMITALLLNFFVLINMLNIGPGDEIAFILLVCFYGITGGAVSFFLTPSMMADTIDFDEWHNGQRREGAHLGVMFFLGNIAMGVSIMLIFYLLGLLGYEGGKPLGATTVQSIRYMFILIPSILGAVEVLLFFRYPITQALHQKIRDDIETRQ